MGVETDVYWRVRGGCRCLIKFEPSRGGWGFDVGWSGVGVVNLAIGKCQFIRCSMFCSCAGAHVCGDALEVGAV